MTGQIVEPYGGPRRTEADFLQHVEAVTASDRAAQRWHFVVHRLLQPDHGKALQMDLPRQGYSEGWSHELPGYLRQPVLVHIHSGRCGVDTLGGVEYGLTSFVDGSGFSVTTVDVPLSGLRTGDFAVNSHKKGEPGVYTSCGNIPAEAEALTIALDEENKSGQSGWATLTARSGKTDVVLYITPGSLATELVHIHSGQCGADTLGGVEHGLTSFVDGSGFSATTVDAPLSSLRTGDFAVNSHKKGESGVYTSCGNIPAGEATAAPLASALSVAIANFRFSPNSLEIKAGQKAQLMLTGDGRGHTFTVESLGVDVVVAAGATQIIEFEVPASASGTITFRCRYHSSGGTGMVGELKILGTSSRWSPGNQRRQVDWYQLRRSFARTGPPVSSHCQVRCSQSH